MSAKDGRGSRVTRDEGESGAKTVQVGSVDTGSRSVPVKNNQRAVGGDGSVGRRFIQESSSNPPPRHVWSTKEKWKRWERQDKENLGGKRPQQVQEKKSWHLPLLEDRRKAEVG